MGDLVGRFCPRNTYPANVCVMIQFSLCTPSCHIRPGFNAYPEINLKAE